MYKQAFKNSFKAHFFTLAFIRVEFESISCCFMNLFQLHFTVFVHFYGLFCRIYFIYLWIYLGSFVPR